MRRAGIYAIRPALPTGIGNAASGAAFARWAPVGNDVQVGIESWCLFPSRLEGRLVPSAYGLFALPPPNADPQQLAMLGYTPP